MLTVGELIRAVGIPVIIATLIALLGWRQNWAWAMPLAAGAGFLVGYALLGLPRLPPRDGTDWLFWLGFPVTVLGIGDAIFGHRWNWILGTVAGGVAAVILSPLVPASITQAECWIVPIGFAAVGAGITCLLSRIEPRVGSRAIICGLCVALGGAAITVMSSNLRAVGTYGIAASAALAPVALFSGRLHTSRSMTLVAIPLLAGLLVGGHAYPDPGVSWPALIVLMLSPAMLAMGWIMPARKKWVPGLVAVLAVILVVGIVTVPAAVTAKKAAESNQPNP